MPHTYTKEQLNERYEALPEVLKEAMFSADVAQNMFEIGKKHGLTIEKTGITAEETGLVILGLRAPAEFASSLSRALDISEDAARTIASDISHEIFFPLRQALKDAHQIKVGDEEIMRPASAPAPRSAPMPVPPQAPIPAPAPQKIAPTAPEPEKSPTPPAAQPVIPNPAPMPQLKPEEIKLEPPRPPPIPSESPRSPAPIKLMPLAAVSHTQEPTRLPDTHKTPPIDLRALSKNMEKEAAPLVGGLTRAPDPESAPVPAPAPAPATQPNVPRPAFPPTHPKIPLIDLRPKPAEPDTAKIKTPKPSSYDGLDPYKEPVE